VRQGGLDRHEDGPDVDSQKPVVFGHRELLDRGVMRGACVVHQDLEAAEPADGLGYRCAKRFRVGTVGLDRPGRAAGADDLLLKVVCWTLGLSVRERHGGTIGREPSDDAGADPPRTPGDQGSPARERGPGDIVELCCFSHDCSFRIERFVCLRRAVSKRRFLSTIVPLVRAIRPARSRALLSARFALRGG
jgi:hypothetical protein